MRFTRLLLERYGHVSGECLDFPPEHGLHVVFGANEAGKSTALEAIADGLFGFQNRNRNRSRASHPDDPRVGLTLRGADGFEASFVRRKLGRDKLLDAAGAAVSETALGRFLGGTGRERFQEVFGLDGERLRKAGRAIMAEQGEAGAAILSARTGLHGLRESTARLEAEAKTLFGDGRGQRRISVATEAIKANRRLVTERNVSGADYLAARKREAELVLAAGEVEAERQALRAEQARLARIRATAPVRRELADIAVRFETLGPAASLPGDATQRFEAALVTCERSARDRDREEGSIAEIDQDIAKLHLDPTILAETDAITALDKDLKRIAEARRDYLRVTGEAQTTLATIDQHARRLGVPERGPALAMRLPNLVTRSTAEGLLKRHTLETAAFDAAETNVQRAEYEAEEATQALAALPEATDAEALREAVEEVRNAGPIEATLAKAVTERDETASEADRRLAQLALWTGTLAELEATSVPLDAEATRLGAEFERSAAALRV